MRPPNCPSYAWIRAAENAVYTGHNVRNFWGWSRIERAKVLLAALDEVPSECATKADIGEAYQDCWEAAFAAACEVFEDRRRRKQERRCR